MNALWSRRDFGQIRECFFIELHIFADRAEDVHALFFVWKTYAFCESERTITNPTQPTGTSSQQKEQR